MHCAVAWEKQRFSSPSVAENQVRAYMEDEMNAQYAVMEDHKTGNRYMFEPEDRTGMPSLKGADGIWRLEARATGATGRSFASVYRAEPVEETITSTKA